MSDKEKGLRENRKICYRSRDLYFECLDANSEDENKCGRELTVFNRDCHESWVKHFIRLRGMQKYKQVVAVQDDGIKTIEEITGLTELAGHSSSLLSRTSTTPSSSTNANSNVSLLLEEVDTHFLEWLRRGDIRHVNSRVNQLYNKNEPAKGIEVLNRIIKQQAMNARLLMGSVRIIALAMATDANLLSNIEGGLPALVALLRSYGTQIANENIRCTIELLLDGCEQKWEKLPELLAKSLEKETCFHLLCGIALAQGRIDVVGQLCDAVTPKQPFYAFAKYPFWTNFLRAVKKKRNEQEAAQLMGFFMDQLVQLENAVNEEEAEFIKQALSSYSRWKVKEANIDPNTHVCTFCNQKMIPNKSFSDAEFALLKLSFAKLLYDGVLRKESVREKQLRRLESALERMNSLAEVDKLPLVVDLLNVVEGVPTPEKLDFLYDMMRKLSNEGHSPILVVTKMHLTDAFRMRLKTLNVVCLELFSKKVDDDLVFLNAVFQLGPNARLVSRDLFADHLKVCMRYKHMLDSDITLFERWRRARVITFQVPNPRNPDGEIWLPPTYHIAVQGDVASGYHIVQEGTRHHREIVYCVRTNVAE